MRRLLVLRPEPGASATVGKARGMGLDAVAIPLFKVDPLPWEAPDAGDFEGLLLTSANAVRCGGEGLAFLRSLPVYAVGTATADAAQEAGFSIAYTGDAGVDRLLTSIAPGLRLLHLCGEDRQAPTDAVHRIAAIPVYRATPAAEAPLEGMAGAVALIHSPRAGRRFGELVVARASMSIAAISAGAAQAVGSGWAAVEIAESPSDDALLALAARLCDKPPPK